jgi:pSer/pThr/pTyr-binding forkhead associated (FHA) protein
MIDARLVMFRSGGERRDFPLSAERTLIGRKNDCDIRIPLTEVSRHHTEFRVENDVIMVRDLGSANGTFVNNKRVSACKLSPGDHVIIGPVVFTLQVGGKPADIRPVKTRLKRQAPTPAGDEELKLGAPAVAASGSSALTDDELDPISALEALASSADQTAIDPFEEEEL